MRKLNFFEEFTIYGSFGICTGIAGAEKWLTLSLALVLVFVYWRLGL